MHLIANPCLNPGTHTKPEHGLTLTVWHQTQQTCMASGVRHCSARHGASTSTLQCDTRCGGTEKPLCRAVLGPDAAAGAMCIQAPAPHHTIRLGVTDCNSCSLLARLAPHDPVPQVRKADELLEREYTAIMPDLSVAYLYM